MTASAKATAAAVAPYAVWMGLMSLLPATAGGYAARAAATAAALAAGLLACVRRGCLDDVWGGRASAACAVGTLLWGVGAGLAVCFLWIWPERFAAYRDFSLLGALGLASSAPSSEPSPYDPAVCGWALTWVRLVGSAFVIAPVEELFFRSFLYRWLQKGDWTKVPLSRFDVSAFLWMVGVFALEHHTRLAVGAMAGAAYGLLAVRRGLGAAVVAHVVTNLALGLYVVRTGEWGFW
jgi:CAAX prenyl protease-like protein